LATFEGRITVISYVSCICLTVSGIVDEDQPRTVRQRCSTIGCMASTLTIAEYHDIYDRFTDRAITASHQVADGVHSAIIRATKPAAAGTPAEGPETAGACRGVNACRTSGETAADPALTVTEAKTASGCGCQD
jgi:hypothetical protein